MSHATKSHPLSLLGRCLSLAFAVGLSACGGDGGDVKGSFIRSATFPICAQVGSSCESSDETAAEIVAASADGMTLIYTNSPREEIGFVDIRDPAAPVALGRLAMGGEPTSVAVRGAVALVAVNTSPSFTAPSGELVLVDIATRSVLRRISLGGQPDAVSVSPDGRYAAVAIENERDESVNGGQLPQGPSGRLVVVDMVGAPSAWTTRNIALDGVNSLFPTDLEPEYVDINRDNVAVLSLQENNHLALVDLATGTLRGQFSAGSVDLSGIDLTDNRPALISQVESSADIRREPDGVAWLSSSRFATADEGDLVGGSRGFTIFNTDGSVAFSSGNLLDRLAARLGHYPDRRSDAKGNEPENVDSARFGDEQLLFVASERSSLVFVFDVADPTRPVFKQALPTGQNPEGVIAIPSRGLLVAASEIDDRSILTRAGLSIYRYTVDATPAYPTLQSADRADGSPIPWSAMSGLAASPTEANTVFAIDDSFFRASRIFTLDVSARPAVIRQELRITDRNGVLAATPAADAMTANRATTFDTTDRAAMINADGTVNLDSEGIAIASDGGFWIASEGAGTVVGETGRPVTSANMILKVGSDGVIQRVIRLPEAVDAIQFRFGFEGVAESNDKLVVAFQRAWNGEGNPRLGIFDLATSTWRFVFYPLEAVTSPNGGWVGLSEVTALGNDEFMAVERDNQGGPDARIKRLTRFSLAGVADGATVTKTLVRDLLPDLRAAGGQVVEKIEGATRLSNGRVLIVNDNDGVNENTGETLLIDLGRLF